MDNFLESGMDARSFIEARDDDNLAFKIEVIKPLHIGEL